MCSNQFRQEHQIGLCKRMGLRNETDRQNGTPQPLFPLHPPIRGFITEHKKNSLYQFLNMILPVADHHTFDSLHL